MTAHWIRQVANWYGVYSALSRKQRAVQPFLFRRPKTKEDENKMKEANKQSVKSKM